MRILLMKFEFWFIWFHGAWLSINMPGEENATTYCSDTTTF
jgi:hypothetical protein